MVRKVPERVPLPASSDSALRAALLDVLQQDGYAINQLLGAFENGAFTPTLTFATPGDLSVVYARQEGSYWRIGSLAHFRISVVCTPTFTTASGNALFGALPLAASASLASQVGGAYVSGSGITWPTGRTRLNSVISPSATDVRIVGTGTGTTGLSFAASNFSSGSPIDVHVFGAYQVDFSHP